MNVHACNTMLKKNVIQCLGYKIVSELHIKVLRQFRNGNKENHDLNMNTCIKPFSFFFWYFAC